MLSAEGGVEIEAGGRDQPRRHRQDLASTRSTGSTEAAAREWVAGAKLDPEATERRGRHPAEALPLLRRGRRDLAEINPLILTPEGKVHALDAKVTLDDNAAFRHPEWEEFDGDPGASTRARRWPRRRASSTSASTASVGIIANGAGLAMSTLDVVNQVGGSAGQLPRHRRRRQRRRDGRRARGHQLRPEASRSIFINIFGGITRGDEVANGIVEALGRVEHRLADRDPPRRHQRRRGPRDPRPTTCPTRLISRAHHARRRPHAVGRQLAHGEDESERMSIFVDETTKVVIQGLTGPARACTTACATGPTAPRSSAGTNPKKAGTEIEGIPVFAIGGRGGEATGATASFIFIPAPGVRPTPSSRRPRPASPSSSASPRASPPRTRRWSSTSCERDFPGTRLLGPNCPGIISPGKCNIGITAGDIALAGGPVGHREPLGHAHLPGAVRAQAAGHRRRPPASASAATRSRAPASSTAWRRSRPTPRPRPS